MTRTCSTCGATLGEGDVEWSDTGPGWNQSLTHVECGGLALSPAPSLPVVVNAAAERFDARPLDRASIKARAELATPGTPLPTFGESVEALAALRAQIPEERRAGSQVREMFAPGTPPPYGKKCPRCQRPLREGDRLKHETFSYGSGWFHESYEECLAAAKTPQSARMIPPKAMEAARLAWEDARGAWEAVGCAGSPREAIERRIARHMNAYAEERVAEAYERGLKEARRLCSFDDGVGPRWCESGKEVADAIERALAKGGGK